MKAVEPPVCPVCRGTGWIISEQHEVSGATRCNCVVLERAATLEERSQIPPLYAKAAIDNFILPLDNPMGHKELADVMMLVRAFQRTYPDPKKPGLLFIGDPGTGKTHLAVAVLRSLMERGHEGLFFDYQTLLDRIRSGFSKESGISDKEAYRVAMDTEILLLDDLGAHRVLDWVEDTVTAIVTHRCNHRKTLIATTNLTDAERPPKTPEKNDYRVLSLTERIGERARSRLFEMCTVIRMPRVRDYRLPKSAHT